MGSSGRSDTSGHAGVAIFSRNGWRSLKRLRGNGDVTDIVNEKVTPKNSAVVIDDHPYV